MGTWPDWMEDRMLPFAEMIDGAKKYVVSSTLDQVDWNAGSRRATWRRPSRSSSRSPARACTWKG